jgi:hypothetical protein
LFAWRSGGTGIAGRAHGPDAPLGTLRACRTRFALGTLSTRGARFALQTLRACGTGGPCLALETLRARGARFAGRAGSSHGPDRAHLALGALGADRTGYALRADGALVSGQREQGVRRGMERLARKEGRLVDRDFEPDLLANEGGRAKIEVNGDAATFHGDVLNAERGPELRAGAGACVQAEQKISLAAEWRSIVLQLALVREGCSERLGAGAGRESDNAQRNKYGGTVWMQCSHGGLLGIGNERPIYTSRA